MTITPVKNEESAELSATGGEAFPSARYFQVHFEHLEKLLDDTRSCLDALRRQVAEVQQGGGSPSPARAGRAGGRPSLRPSLGLQGDDLLGGPRCGAGSLRSIAPGQVEKQ